MSAPGLKPTVELRGAGALAELYDTASSRSLSLSPLEARLLALWDGVRSASHLTDAARAQGLVIEARQAAVFLERLDRAGFLAAAPTIDSGLVPDAPGLEHLSDRVPKLRADLLIEKPEGAKGVLRVTDLLKGRSFTLYDFEVSVARQLDGRRTASEVLEATARLGIPVTLESLRKFVRQLRGYRFIDERAQPAGPTPGAGPSLDTWTPELREMYDSALRLKAQGKTDQALEYLVALLEVNPHLEEPRELKARLELEREGAVHVDVSFDSLHGVVNPLYGAAPEANGAAAAPPQPSATTQGAAGALEAVGLPTAGEPTGPSAPAELPASHAEPPLPSPARVPSAPTAELRTSPAEAPRPSPARVPPSPTAELRTSPAEAKRPSPARVPSSVGLVPPSPTAELRTSRAEPPRPSPATSASEGLLPPSPTAELRTSHAEPPLPSPARVPTAPTAELRTSPAEPPLPSPARAPSAPVEPLRPSPTAELPTSPTEAPRPSPARSPSALVEPPRPSPTAELPTSPAEPPRPSPARAPSALVEPPRPSPAVHRAPPSVESRHPTAVEPPRPSPAAPARAAAPTPGLPLETPARPLTPASPPSAPAPGELGDARAPVPPRAADGLLSSDARPTDASAEAQPAAPTVKAPLAAEEPSVVVDLEGAYTSSPSLPGMFDAAVGGTADGAWPMNARPGPNASEAPDEGAGGAATPPPDGASRQPAGEASAGSHEAPAPAQPDDDAAAALEAVPAARPRRRRRLLPFAVGVLGVALLGVGALLMRPVPRRYVLPARVSPVPAQPVTAPREGRLGAFAVEAGTTVEAGAALGTLDDGPAAERLAAIQRQRDEVARRRAALKSAPAKKVKPAAARAQKERRAWEAAAARLARAEALPLAKRKKALPKAKKAAAVAKAKLTKAEAALEALTHEGALKRLADEDAALDAEATQLREAQAAPPFTAPSAGRVTFLKAPGEDVSAGEAVARVDPGQWRVEAWGLVRLPEGQPVKATLTLAGGTYEVRDAEVRPDGAGGLVTSTAPLEETGTLELSAGERPAWKALLGD